MLEEDKRGILLESGTNEIEVMEFTINDSLYGINVAKVKEILVSQPVKHMPTPRWRVFSSPGIWSSLWWICPSTCWTRSAARVLRTCSLLPISTR